MLSRDSIMFLINHVFLPPKLPQKNDSQQGFGEVLMDVMIDALQDFLTICGERRGETGVLIDMVFNAKKVHDAVSEDLSEIELRQVLVKIVEQGGYLPLYVRAQNAGVLVSRTGDYLRFEMFELSPLNEAVMTTKGRLRRSFPASSIGVHLTKARTSDFQTTVAQTLALMSHQAVAGMQPQVRKAGELLDENRDTTHPGMVTEFFDGFLTSNGTPLDVVAVGKNTREDVLWSDAKVPWRRSALWLLLRVSLHLCCGKLAESNQESYRLYKQVMLVFMSSIMKLSERFRLPTEYLHIMSAKLSRRVHKLGDEIAEAALERVRFAVEINASTMSQRWTAIQQRDVRCVDLAALPALNFDLDCSMNIPRLDEFIVGIKNRQAIIRGTNFQPTSDTIHYSDDALPPVGFGDRSKEEVVIQNLHAFETWVERNLPAWLEVNSGDANACGLLANLIQQYHSTAEQYYARNPESMSLMVLVLLELWVGCDRIATSICSLLGEYHPGVPNQHLQNLLLPFEVQMTRLHRVEEHLVTRARAPRPPREIFETTDSPNGFGARYFDQSVDLQALMQTIVDRATQARESKLDELERLQARYQTLMTQFHQVHCDFVEIIDRRTGLSEERHSGNCVRCQYKSQADRLEIQVHEWPLPENQCRAKTVTFELRVPSWFGNWRESTAYITMHVLKAEYASDVRPRSPQLLSSDRQLASSYFRRFNSVQPQCIGLLSQDKPHIGTHRRGKEISISKKKDICLRSGLNYQYYDAMRNCFVNALRHTENMPQLCTYQLSSKALQDYVFRPANAPSGPPPNLAIAEQSKCPQQMPLSQWKALSSIPLGYHLHWWQVAMQLRMPLVDFKQTDTALVVLQCIHQAGPPCDGNKIRPGHWLAADRRFSVVILEQLNESLIRIKQNWESSQALSLFVCIARRLLSLNADHDIRAACLKYLCDARAVAFDWVGILKTKADFAQSTDRGQLVFTSVVAAVICASTFDVDRRYLAEVLTPALDASILMQCCITIREGGRAIHTSSDTQLKLLHSRHLRLLRDAFAILADNQEALHNAISQSWSGYRCSADWVVTESAPHWVVTHTDSSEENGSSVVHYDLLSGSLLVDGQPLGRLPSQYEKHDSYERLFGNSTIEVMPSNTAGLAFSAKTPYFGYSIQFGMGISRSSSANDLLVQASEGSPERIYELLPPRLFQGHVPTSFVCDFVHWYDRSSGDVEFRPANEPWTRHSSGEWRLVKCEDSKWRLRHPGNGMYLVGASSQTAGAITTILSPLAKPLSIHLLLRPNLSSLDIEIPTLCIGFTLERGLTDLGSREFPDMQVDEDQSLGALVGFRNKLLIKSRHTDEQKVILLEGHTTCRGRINSLSDSSKPFDDHSEVSVDRDVSSNVHFFDIDKQLGGLVDNGSMQSKLVLAYLHDLTSFCMPDPLTGRTGTEEALTILRSAALRSLSKLTQANINMLERIANDLTPKRVFYPEHERVMQSVRWSSTIGFMSQHAGFYSAVVAILEHEKRYHELFHQSGIMLPSIGDVNPHLLERDRIRSAAFQVSEYGAEDHTTENDVEYSSRDRGRQSRRRADAYLFSSHISQGRATLNSGRTSSSILWKVLCRSSRIFGPCHQSDLSQIRYDASLLQDGGNFISEAWPFLHRALAERQPTVSTRLRLRLSQCSSRPSISPEFSPPQRKIFDVSAGYQVLSNRLKQEIRLSLRSFHNCPEAKLVKDKYESRSDFGRRVKCAYEAQQDIAVDKLASALEIQWPCELPHKPEIQDSIDVNSYIDVERAMRTINPIFSSWFHNLELFRYLQRIETETSLLAVHNINIPTPVSPEPHFILSHYGFVRYSDLFDRPAPCLELTVPPLQAAASVLENEGNFSRLNSFVDEIERDSGSSEYERKYFEGLKASVSCLLKGTSSEHYEVPSYDTIKAHWQFCIEQEQKLYDSLKSATTPSCSDRPALKMVALSNRWPRLSPKFFLQQLGRHRWGWLNPEWKACIVQYAISLTLCHRAERLLKAFQAGGPEDIINELRNEGHKKWDPMNHPERLLLEVESKIMVRDIQSDVANQMEDPQSARNTSMQLNMGEGKSSVIVPIVAAALANESRLVRVIVGKPQSRQMTQMLISKLGSMLDRRIYHMPFSRKIKLNESAANRVRGLCRECMENGGVLLLQPEHILSFQLMGLERCITGEVTVGRSLLHTQAFFDQASRDIVDESDENFSVKFELVYSMGTQRPIDASPDRWLCIQEVLDLVKEIAPIVAAQLPSSMEITPCAPGAFPKIRILRPDAENLLIERVGRRVCELGLAGFPVSRQARSIRDAVFTYITKWDLSATEIQLVECSSSGTFWTESIQPKLFLLRGLLACGILGFAFNQKRWRVNYGLDTSREPPTRLAVPYRAKDMPTSRSEFSHPDVVILLTTLSYYYGGLTDGYLDDSFSHLTQSDQKDVEYDIWVKGIPDMPEAFRQLDGINLKDRSDCSSTVFPKLRHSKKVVDYFLSHIVYPKEMREFPKKLSASGWDIGKMKQHPTTAFSGTSDARILLPLDVDYFDSEQQRHTNGLVLGYLLQPENSVAFIPAAAGTRVSDAERLLSEVVNMNPPPRVILDAGAQILEMTNLEVARAWLDLYPSDSVRAVVFFDENDELSVPSRAGDVESLQTSPFASQLDACLVFLDQAHTRGTDLRLPRDYRAAVTLGPNLTKDRLVQACMRMRKLGKGQSVIFCVTEEIRAKIHDRTSKNRDAGVSVADVLRWAIFETYTEIRQNIPLWAQQGLRFIRHEQLWGGICAAGLANISGKQAGEFLEVEAQTLENRYRPGLQPDTAVETTRTPSDDTKAAYIWERCESFQELSFRGSRMQEEQERELSPEMQQERQVQRPPPAQPEKHRLDPDVTRFVSTGIVSDGSKAYMPAFATLTEIGPAKSFPIVHLAGDECLLATADFARTVRKAAKPDTLDAYLRPVQWVLTTVSEDSNCIKRALVISPYEAQQLFQSICRSKKVVLHSYQPRWNRAYPTLDQLDFFTVPTLERPRELAPSLVVQLNLFAGQLYHNNLQDYREMCEFLGLASERNENDWVIGADGFIQQDDVGRVGGVSRLTRSPVAFLKAYMKIRKDGESISRTHVGDMLDGMLLCESDFDAS